MADCSKIKLVPRDLFSLSNNLEHRKRQFGCSAPPFLFFYLLPHNTTRGKYYGGRPIILIFIPNQIATMTSRCQSYFFLPFDVFRKKKEAFGVRLTINISQIFLECLIINVSLVRHLFVRCALSALTKILKLNI